MALQATLSVSLNSTLTEDTPADLEAAQSLMAYAPSFTFSNGTGNNQANTIFSDTRTLTSGSSETLDLSGSLTDKVCDLISATTVKALLIRAHATNTTTISFGPNSTNGWITPFGDASDRVKVLPGGLVLLIAPDSTGYAVTAGTGDLLFISNAAGASATYDIIFMAVDT